MSKAFTNEDTPTPDEADALPPRARRLPITPAGVARLRSELAGLRAVGPSEIGARRARVIVQALESVYVVEPSAAEGRVSFGACVTVEDASAQRTSYEIVGPDEADPTARRISIESPVARALLGKRAGDPVVLPRPKGAAEVTVVLVTLPTPPADDR